MKNKYSIFSLIKNSFSYHENWQKAWRDPEPKSTYDAVIIGGGGHGLEPTGMIFFFAPTGQFLLGIFYYGEYLDLNKLISFVIIWIAVIIYLRDLTNDMEEN